MAINWLINEPIDWCASVHNVLQSAAQGLPAHALSLGGFCRRFCLTQRNRVPMRLACLDATMSGRV